MTILGIDPAIATIGWSIVREPAKIISLGVITSEHDAFMDESTDRARRIRIASDELIAIARRHGVTAIAAEAMSFGGSPKARFRMAISIGLCWGALIMLASSLGVPLLEVPPKQWQHAVLPSAKRRVNYDAVYRLLHGFVAGQGSVELQMLRKSLRNHALDASGVALFASLRPGQATRIGAAA